MSNRTNAFLHFASPLSLVLIRDRVLDLLFMSRTALLLSFASKSLRTLLTPSTSADSKQAGLQDIPPGVINPRLNHITWSQADRWPNSNVFSGIHRRAHSTISPPVRAEHSQG